MRFQSSSRIIPRRTRRNGNLSGVSRFGLVSHTLLPGFQPEDPTRERTDAEDRTRHEAEMINKGGRQKIEWKNRNSTEMTKKRGATGREEQTSKRRHADGTALYQSLDHRDWAMILQRIRCLVKAAGARQFPGVPAYLLLYYSAALCLPRNGAESIGTCSVI